MAEGTVLTKYSTGDSEFLIGVQTAAGMTSNLKDCPALNFPWQLIDAWVIMSGAGAAADTVKIQKVRAASATDVTAALDVSAFADNQMGRFVSIDDAQHEFQEGDNVRILTASDALCRVWIRGIKNVATP